MCANYFLKKIFSSLYILNKIIFLAFHKKILKNVFYNKYIIKNLSFFKKLFKITTKNNFIFLVDYITSYNFWYKHKKDIFIFFCISLLLDFLIFALKYVCYTKIWVGYIIKLLIFFVSYYIIIILKLKYSSNVSNYINL